MQDLGACCVNNQSINAYGKGSAFKLASARIYVGGACTRRGVRFVRESEIGTTPGSMPGWGDSNIAVISPSFCWLLMTERDIACAKTQLISDAHCQKEKESSMSLSLCLTGVCVGYATQWNQQWRVCAAVRGTRSGV